MELPVIHPDFEEMYYCVFWGAQFTTPGRKLDSFSVIKLNLCTGESATALREGHFSSEHRFIPRPGGMEVDEGALAGIVYDGVNGTSFMQVLDAMTLIVSS